MTEDELKAIEARCNAATPEPWDDKPATPEWRANLTANSTFCRHARTDVPALIAEVRRLREALGQIISMADDCQAMSRQAADTFIKTARKALDEK